METIKTYVVEFDLTEVQMLYDYGQEKYYTRPPGGWQLPDIRQQSSQNREVADAKTSVQLLDEALNCWGCFENDIADKKDAKNSARNTIAWQGKPDVPTLPKRVMPVYRPGDTVRGRVLLELTEKMEAESFYVTFKGGARVNIRVYHQRGWFDDYGSDHYVNETGLIWKRATHVDDLSDSMSLLSCDENASPPSTDGKSLRPGPIAHSFIFNVPEEARSACPPLIESHSDFGHVLYRVKACIDKGKLWSIGNIVSGHAVWVNKDYDIASIPDALAPFTAEESMSTGLIRSGKIACKVSLPQKAFVRGDLIPLSLYVENTDSSEVSKVSARVKLCGRIHPAKTSVVVWRSVDLKGEKVSAEEKVPADSVRQLQLQVPLKFPEIDDNLIPAGTLDDVILIEVRYELLIKLKRSGLHRDMELKIPIIIGNKNSSIYPNV